MKTLHEAGIEVILDVVYNHTAEGNHLGPMLSLQGHRQPRLLPARRRRARYYFDTTGTGNTLNMRHPHVLQLIIDSLRYWVTEMHVDGFRFDLAASLARAVPRGGPAVGVLRPHPGRTRSSARSSSSPSRGTSARAATRSATSRPLWSEWNGSYRDTVRDFWRGADGTLAGVRLPADRQLRPVRADRAAPRRQRSTSSPPTTASPSPTWSPTTTSTTRPTARTTGTAPTTTGRGTAASRARPTIPAILRAARRRQQRNFLTTLLLLARACR